jgi:hypothetical protein
MHRVTPAFSLILLALWSYWSAVIVLLVLVAIGLWRLLIIWQDIRRTARVVGFLAPALAELDEFYELIELSVEKSHFFQRHGPMLKIADILERARTGGMRVSGLSGKPVSSARWYRHADLLHAIRETLARWKAGERPRGGVFVFRFDAIIGEGYEKDGTDLMKTHIAVVVIRDGVVITAYPLLRNPV